MPEPSDVAATKPLSRRKITRQFVVPTLWKNGPLTLGLLVLSVLLSVVPALKTALESTVINGINTVLTDKTQGRSFDDALDAAVDPISNDATGFEGWVLGLATKLFDNATLAETALSYAIVTLIAALLAWLSVVLRSHIERDFFTELRSRAMDTSMDPAAASLPLQERDERGITVQQGAVNIAAGYTNALEAVQFVLTLGVTALVLAGTSWWLAGAVLAVVFVQTGVMYAKTRHLRGKRHELEEKRDEVVRKSDDIIQNRDFIAAHEQRANFSEKLRKLAARYGLIEQGLARRDQGYRQFATVVGDAGRLVILFLAVAIAMGVFGATEQEKVSSVGDAYFLIAIYARMLAPAQGILNVWDGYVRQRDVSRRFRALLTAREELDAAVPGTVTEAEVPPLAAEFNDVYYAYPTPEGRKAALQGCSFTVPRGKTTLIVGRSGSGKTTIARMLLGYIRPNDGTVEVLGQDVQDWQHEALLLKMSYLAQGDYVVEDTVRENLFANKNDDELGQVLARVGLDDAELGKIATKLSIGQKQRVGLARLLLDRADIVLLDEPLSGVDAFTLMELDEELRGYFGDDSRTFVVISHRLMFTSYADHVVVIEDGVKVEEGSPAELRDKPGGRFAALVSAARTEIGA